MLASQIPRTRIAIDLGNIALCNLAAEFWPDIKQKLSTCCEARGWRIAVSADDAIRAKFGPCEL